MSIRGPDINADYLQIRNIEIIRGDTFGMQIRLKINGTPDMLTETGFVTFSVFKLGRTAIITVVYDQTMQDANGYINVSLTPEQTSILSKSNDYTYELEWYINSSTIYTILQGRINIIADKIISGNRGD